MTYLVNCHVNQAFGSPNGAFFSEFFVVVEMQSTIFGEESMG